VQEFKGIFYTKVVVFVIFILFKYLHGYLINPIFPKNRIYFTIFAWLFGPYDLWAIKHFECCQTKVWPLSNVVFFQPDEVDNLV